MADGKDGAVGLEKALPAPPKYPEIPDEMPHYSLRACPFLLGKEPGAAGACKGIHCALFVTQRHPETKAVMDANCAVAWLPNMLASLLNLPTIHANVQLDLMAKMQEAQRGAGNIAGVPWRVPRKG